MDVPHATTHQSPFTCHQMWDNPELPIKQIANVYLSKSSIWRPVARSSVIFFDLSNYAYHQHLAQAMGNDSQDSKLATDSSVCVCDTATCPLRIMSSTSSSFEGPRLGAMLV
jgi:hypothetical protein